ncbi:H(+)/Cl(-) exchange transporter ClcA [Novipirellula aureliae]|uniref:H(+)/Cl(-) exchange transporter ClcA n=1 Tax=Novipirellula aureliae TaxID=2527966 RepID=A0A5C6ED37_9BACT|nr:chloride channel protein [Novipirellula aureliae]TWU45887.1 H(+)/Cl(-) exchange transporter ClcA [Novipirellula aureliae]
MTQPDEVTSNVPAPDPMPISPALESLADAAPVEPMLVDRRVVWLSGLALMIGVTAALIAVALMKLIALITNVAFYGRWSLGDVSPADNQLGWYVVFVPIMGAIVIGFMARYGSKAIRGHGIPEAMEQVLTNRSRIPARVTLLKPLSSAISIGTGGPFGAEGPIIATGGALGSLLGQFLHTAPTERKTLLAVGAASGMAATFGSPVSAVLLAIELLLFEFRPRSMIPVAIGTTAAAGMRIMMEGGEPAFPMTDIAPATLAALIFYLLLGCAMGIVAAVVSWAVYAIEDGFERLPIHWMWWPALGAIVVGVVGYFAPHTLGVGYDNISAILSDELTTSAILFLCSMKFISWSIALGSGTSGGTLAPMFTIGGGIGHLVGTAAILGMPFAGIDVRVAALVGMAAIFAGASRAWLASAVFAFETTHQTHGLLPLLGGCATSYIVATLLTKNSIMTEKISRRGVRAPQEFVADPLQQISAIEIATKEVVTLKAEQTISDVRHWFNADSVESRHQGYPVVNECGTLIGIVTRRDLFNSAVDAEGRLRDILTQPPRFVYDDCMARQAADHMINHAVGRLPIVTREKPARLVGILTRSDLLGGYRQRMDESAKESPTVCMPRLRRRKS